MNEQELCDRLAALNILADDLNTRLQLVELKTKTIPANLKLEEALAVFNDECLANGILPSDIIEIRSMLRSLSASGSGRIFRYGLIHTLAWPLTGLAAIIKKSSEALLKKIEAAEAKAKAKAEAKATATTGVLVDEVPADAIPVTQAG